MRRLRNILLTLAGTLAIVSMTCNGNRSDKQQLTREQINYQMTELTIRAHPLPGLYENEAFQRHVNPHLYGEGKKIESNQEKVLQEELFYNWRGSEELAESVRNLLSSGHALPDVFNNPSFQRHVNPHLYGETKK